MISKTHPWPPRKIAILVGLISLAASIGLSFSFTPDASAKPLAAATPSVSIAPSSVMIGEDFSFTVTFDNTGADPGYGPFIDLVFPYTGQDGDDGIEYYDSSYLGAALEDDIQIFPDQGGGWGCVSHPWLRDTNGDYVDVCGSAGDQFVSIRLPFGSFTTDQPALDVTVNAHLSIDADLTPDLLIYARGGFMFGETPEDDWCCGDAPFAVPNGTDSTGWPSSPVTPQVMTFDKAYIGPGNTEDETATGPNFPRQYTLTLDIAAGQTLDSIVIQDQLPDNVQFIGIDAAGTTAGCAATTTPSTVNPGGDLVVECGSQTGTVVVTFDFYIPELYDNTGGTTYDDPVIDPASGDDVSSGNIAWVDASWDPHDSDDPLTPLTSDATCPTCTPLHTLADKSIAIQKSVAVVPGTGGGPSGDQVAPNAILEYTLSIQVSDFFTFDSLVVTDVLEDGQHVVPTSIHNPTVQVSSNPGAFGPVLFNSANYDISCDYTGATTISPPPTECTIVTAGATGQTTLEFRLSDEIASYLADGTMRGGCVNPSAPFGLYSPCDRSNLRDGPTTATIVYRTQVLDQFVDNYPSGDISVDQGDELSNAVDVAGNILDNTSGAVIGAESDNATASAAIGRETLAKSIYAINGATSGWDTDALGRVRVNPGDIVTYELEYGLLTSDVEELTFDDYFPLPVFDVLDPDGDGAGEAWAFTSTVGIPAPGVVGLHPNDTFYTYMDDGLNSLGTGTISASTNNPGTMDPVVAADGTNNKINIYYADYDDTRNQSTTVDLLISIVVKDDPFADGLFLTNMAHAFEGSTNAGTNTENAIVQFVIGEPVLVTTKGVVYSSNSAAVFDTLPAGPVGFLSPSDPQVPPRWTGVISSNGLSGAPIDSNISEIDAGDLLTFAIMIENQGTSINGAFDIQLRDILDTAYYQIPIGGLNLQVYYGDGTGPIPYQAVDGSCLVDPGADNEPCGEEIFEEGLELIDPVGAGVCSAHDPNAGNNIILVTYDLELRPDVIPGQALNTATVFNFAGTEGGPNHLEFVDDLEDDATADVVGDLEKTLDGTEFDILTHPAGTNLDDEVVIGELVYYTVSAVVPEGIVPLARIVDHLDSGLAFVSCDSVIVTAETGVVTDLAAADFSTVCAATESSGVTNNGEDIVFDLGNITNSDRDDNLERISISYTAVVTNVAGNQNLDPTLLNNQADFLMDDGSGDVSLGTASADEVAVIEPQVLTEKFTPAGTTGTSTTGDAGDAVSFTITLTNPAGANETDAYDLVFVDVLPMCPTPADGSAIENVVIDSQSGNATFVLSGDNASGYTVSASGFDLAPGESTTVDISGVLDYCVIPNTNLINTGTTTWTSLSGDFRSAPRSVENTDSIERNGDDGAGGALDDYASEGSATIAIDNPINSKYLISTSEAHTETVGLYENLAIGEIVRYRLVSTIPEGTSPNFQIHDFLPGGLLFLNDGTAVVAFVSNTGISSTGVGIIPAIPDGPNPPNPDCNQIGSTADASTPVLDPINCTLADNNVGATDETGVDDDNFGPPAIYDPYFKLGTLVNNDSDVDTEYVVLEFNALVHNHQINQNDAGDILGNRHQVLINGVQNGGVSNTINIRVAEPQIDVTKTITGTPPADAGDPITYQIVFSNAASGEDSATAFDLLLTDTFDANLEALSITGVSTSQTDPCVGDGSGSTAFTHSESLAAGTLTVNLSCLDAGENITVDVTGNVIDSILANTELLNTAVGTGTSLPGANGTTGNGTGSDTPGSSGSDTGERDGSDTDSGGRDDYYDAADANHTLTSPAITKYVDAPAEWVIGETFTYDLVVTLPEGVTPDMVVYDDIPVGLEFVSYNLITTSGAAGSRLAADYDGTLPGETATAPGGSGGDLTLNFGDTTTNEEYPESTPTNNSFQVQVTVRVLNVIDNQNGDILTNQGELQYSNGTNPTGTVDVEILEPVIEAVKTTIPSPAQNLDAGDTFQYQLTLSHDLDGSGEDSQADAFDVSLTDLFDAGSGMGLITSIDSVVLNGGASTDSAAAITGGGTGISGQYDIPLGDSVVITYTVELQTSIQPNQTYTNDVDLTWSSLQNNPAEARDGSGGVDDYTTSTSASAQTGDLLSVAKSVIGSSQAHTSGTDLAIGEEVTYSLVVSVIEGTTDTVVVTDTLPDNLNFIPGTASVVPNGPGMTTGYSGTPTWTDPNLAFNLGQVVNPPDNNPANDTITIEFDALVENDAVNQNGNTKTNSASVTDGTLSDSDSADVDLVEPLLVVDKTADDDTPALGQTITYTITVSHDLDGSGEDSQTDAFNVHIQDTLPAGLSNLSNINVSSNGNCATGIDTSGSNPASLDVVVAEVPYTLPSPGCVLTVTYQATVNTPPAPPAVPAVGSTLDNTVVLTWTSLPTSTGNERSGDGVAGNVDDYEAEDTQTVTITNADLRISKDDGVTAYIPGTSLTYTIVVENVGNADALNAEVSDTRPSQISTWTWSCIGATNGASGCTPAASSSNDFSDFVNLPVNSSITYEVNAVIPSGATGTLTNTAQIDMPAGLIEPTPADNVDSDVDNQDSHADLAVDKDDGVTLISPGELITYTILVENLSPSDVSGALVEDTKPGDIDSWTWTCSHAGGASGCTPAPSSANNFSDTVNLPAGSSITYTVTAQVSSSPSGPLTNDVNVSVPAGVTDDDLSNNTDDDVDDFPTQTKSLVANLHGVVPLPDVPIGEILTYEVNLTIPPGSMDLTHLIDTLDRGLAYVGCDSITFGSLTTSAAGGNFTTICDNPTVSEAPSGSGAAEDAGREVDWDFGTLTNPTGSDEDLVIRYQVVVLDSLANQSGSTPPLNNNAEWVWNSGQLDDQATAVTILEPDLQVSKDAFPTRLFPGQLTTYTLVVEHTAGSQTDAYDLVLEDILPAEMIYQSHTHVSGQAPTSIDVSALPTVTISWDAFLNNGTNSVIEIEVMLDPTFRRNKSNQNIVNDASLSWSSLPGDFSAAQSIHNTLSTERFYDPLSNINIYVAGDGARVVVPALPDTGFQPGQVTDIPAQRPEQEYGNIDGLRIEIPKLGLSVPIVSVPITENGWNLTWLWNQAGWLEGTAYPSWYGNTVITGHAYLPSGLPGPFAELDTLNWGDEIILYAHGLRYTYQVRIKDLVDDGDYSILQHKDQDWVTLFTCREYSETIDAYLWRQVVQAVLIDVEEIE